MTDRIKGCVVVFEEDLRVDDAEALLGAIRQLRGVAALSTASVSADDYINRTRIRQEVEAQVLAVFAK